MERIDHRHLMVRLDFIKNLRVNCTTSWLRNFCKPHLYLWLTASLTSPSCCASLCSDSLKGVCSNKKGNKPLYDWVKMSFHNKQSKGLHLHKMIDSPSVQLHCCVDAFRYHNWGTLWKSYPVLNTSPMSIIPSFYTTQPLHNIFLSSRAIVHFCQYLPTIPWRSNRHSDIVLINSLPFTVCPV